MLEPSRDVGILWWEVVQRQERTREGPGSPRKHGLRGRLPTHLGTNLLSLLFPLCPRPRH